MLERLPTGTRCTIAVFLAATGYNPFACRPLDYDCSVRIPRDAKGGSRGKDFPRRLLRAPLPILLGLRPKPHKPSNPLIMVMPPEHLG